MNETPAFTPRTNPLAALFPARDVKTIGGVPFFVSRLVFEQFDDAMVLAERIGLLKALAGSETGFDLAQMLPTLRDLAVGDGRERLLRLLAGSLRLQLADGSAVAVTPADIAQAMPVDALVEAVVVLVEVNTDFFIRLSMGSVMRPSTSTGSASASSSSAPDTTPSASIGTPSPSSSAI